MHLQQAVTEYSRFVRCVGVGPQLHLVNYDPQAPLHDRYTLEHDFLNPEDTSIIEYLTLTINAFFGWDFNSCEALKRDDVWYPIDFANPCPDSQVTSLHWHFPWLVKSIVRWAIYCAASKRRMRMNLDWEPFFAIEQEGGTYRERLSRYAAIARERLEETEFNEFCEKHLAHLDEVVWEFFASAQAKQAVRAYVESLYPSHEIDSFTELIWERIQSWRDQQPENKN